MHPRTEVKIGGSVPLVQRASGIVVPANLETAPEPNARTDQHATAYDLDGRRRVVLTREDQRLINRTLKMLRQHGLAILVMCAKRKDGKPPCEGPLTNDGEPPDDGYGCRCTRVHFR